MRDLKSSDKNELVIHDARSGSDITFYYRNPTTKEEVAYNGKLFQKKGQKIKINVTATRIEFARKIITGFGEKCFGFAGEPISSDPEKENYHKEWKQLLEDTAGDLLNVFAYNIFEGNKVKGTSEEDIFIPEYEEGEDAVSGEGEAEEEAPLESSSGE